MLSIFEERQQREAVALKRDESCGAFCVIWITRRFLGCLRNCRESSAVRPETIAAASRIEGMDAYRAVASDRLQPSGELRIMDVSRETEAQFARYAELITKWNPAINLVAPGTLPDLRNRHIGDSAQMFALAKPRGSWLDLGSGGVGIVIAILVVTCLFRLP